MAKAAPKTQKTKASVAQFIAAVEDEARRKDAKTIDTMMREITGERPAMWGPSIVGYGEYTTPSGPWPRTGFSPRKANLVVYILPGFKDYEALLGKLGKHKTGKSCLYLGKLADVNEAALRDIIKRGWEYMAKKHPE
ncbi:MAG: DUF1801 domain-containing protein [Hyphomonadaceae bacterium]|nr:DUF1801 domain-containing protein [Hyphomonadaceae bacterium]